MKKADKIVIAENVLLKNSENLINHHKKAFIFTHFFNPYLVKYIFKIEKKIYGMKFYNRKWGTSIDYVMR